MPSLHELQQRFAAALFDNSRAPISADIRACGISARALDAAHSVDPAFELGAPLRHFVALGVLTQATLKAPRDAAVSASARSKGDATWGRGRDRVRITGGLVQRPRVSATK